MKASRFTARVLQLLLIVLPMVLALAYYLVIAADRYVSESIVAVRSAALAPTPAGGVSLGGGQSLLGREDTLYLIDYVHSSGLLAELEPALNLREHYSQPNPDLFFRLKPDASREDFLEYFRDRVEVDYDDISGLLTIKAQAFDQATALKLNRAILAASERFVNDFSHRIATEQMKFSQAEADAASGRLKTATLAVAEFQTRNKMLDPIAQSAAANQLTAELQATLARLEADLRGKLAYMDGNSPAVRALRDQIAANRAQLQAERSRATASSSGDRLTALNVEYQDLLLQVQFAQDAYGSAVKALETARIDAAQKVKSLVVVEPPSDPDEAIYPERLYDLFTLFVLCVLTYAIVRLVVATIREHQD